MLNPFPIQYLAMLAYFILRFGIGIILIHLSLRHYSQRQSLKAAFTARFGSLATPSVAALMIGEFCIGVLLILGFQTQYAAIALILMSLDLIITGKLLAHPSIPPRIFYVILLLCALSLFITGAGAFAVDLPL